MLPTAFRELGSDEKLPLTHSGKISMRDVVTQFFSMTGGEMPGVEVLEDEVH